MSDENQSAASSAEQMVPKTRLDELIADRNAERQERMFLQQQLAEAAKYRQPVQQAAQEDPELEALKESNPALYRRMKKQELETKQLRAGFSSLLDQQDRSTYLQEAGADGKKRLDEVERVIHHERTVNRNFNVTRIGVYNWIKGQEVLKREQTAQAAPAPAKASSTEDDIPSSDPKFATTIKGGTAPSNVVEKTRDERIKELENVVF